MLNNHVRLVSIVIQMKPQVAQPEGKKPQTWSSLGLPAAVDI